STAWGVPWPAASSAVETASSALTGRVSRLQGRTVRRAERPASRDHVGPRRCRDLGVEGDHRPVDAGMAQPQQVLVHAARGEGEQPVRGGLVLVRLEVAHLHGHDVEAGHRQAEPREHPLRRPLGAPASGTGPGSRASILPPTWTVSRPPTPADQAASVVDGSTSETISALTSSARISGRPARRASAYVVSSAPPAPGLSPESEIQN